jgi:transketolase
MADQETIIRLCRTAAEIRLLVVRMMGTGKAHHFGGSLSAADIITALYFYKMRFDPKSPKWPERDRLIMSKGHSVPIQYAALAMLGVFDVDELFTLKKLGSRLQGHPAMHLTPGLEGCTGALGEGLSYANGMALAARVNGLSYRVFCAIGDGELQEGQTIPRSFAGNHSAVAFMPAGLAEPSLNPRRPRSQANACQEWANPCAMFTSDHATANMAKPSLRPSTSRT